MTLLLGVVAHSGTGKTTLLKQLIPYLRACNVRVGLIKHSHHSVDVDTPGKDSYELRKAGADQTMVASSNRWALMTETPDAEKLDLHYLASRFDQTTLDLILVEGFKHEKIDKIALFRQASGREIDAIVDDYVLAIATDSQLKSSLPVLDLNNIAEIGNFIVDWLKKRESI
ncbi:molybdopterin-guanine dinucleotide biosynthesis protein MobB [Rouxiella badensis]|uniref:molybdopterin-guanine dinucleotide biosynthesis protein MobB n=1 Tax=Rouxiella badensis TaxID=1646377 RepID=UPI0017885C44|nr:molybdopterin-guanine dinucleotide biosynthesis protein MobB [Rouxiella badensis]MCC3704277.1 molybdopterin-guanine dinucleotide biosynthesis protein MobB [Rouxiella badensis]MCC3749335.1 molybdopterin-guanine dinucleotide biosynthesis protein MobB [Rouxiella badensis]QOI57062.1 molybdopterin-guanine dinucleotide biosynthesis protein B [Rouxiella badensis subsp. acadiensis]